jgi:hypothetical protein
MTKPGHAAGYTASTRHARLDQRAGAEAIAVIPNWLLRSLRPRMPIKTVGIHTRRSGIKLAERARSQLLTGPTAGFSVSLFRVFDVHVLAAQ